VVWDEAKLWDFQQRTAFNEFSDLAEWVLREHKYPELFAMVVWSTWTQRNQVRLQQACCALHLILQVSKDRLEEFRVVHRYGERTEIGSVSRFYGPTEV